MRWTGRPADGRSWSVRRYRLCTRVELVPHVGHEAVGDVVRSMSVISSAISTCSMSKPGRSGKSIIEKMCTSGYGETRKIVQLLSISHLRSAELRKNQNMAQVTRIPYQPINASSVPGQSPLSVSCVRSQSLRNAIQGLHQSIVLMSAGQNTRHNAMRNGYASNARNC